MNENRTSTHRSTEVQLGKRPVETTQAPKNGLPGGAYTKGDPWPHSGATFEANRCHSSGNLQMGEDQRLASAISILEALKGTLVAGKVVKNRAVPSRP